MRHGMVEGRLPRLLRHLPLHRGATLDLGLVWHLLRLHMALPLYRWLQLARVGLRVLRMLRLLHHHAGTLRLLRRLRKGRLACGSLSGRHGRVQHELRVRLLCHGSPSFRWPKCRLRCRWLRGRRSCERAV